MTTPLPLTPLASPPLLFIGQTDTTWMDGSRDIAKEAWIVCSGTHSLSLSCYVSGPFIHYLASNVQRCVIPVSQLLLVSQITAHFEQQFCAKAVLQALLLACRWGW